MKTFGLCVSLDIVEEVMRSEIYAKTYLITWCYQAPFQKITWYYQVPFPKKKKGLALSSIFAYFCTIQQDIYLLEKN